jgi:nucleoid-associated protein YgaU
MFVRCSVALLTLVCTLALAVPRPSSGAPAEERYVVRSGDTLWELASARFGGDPREGVWRIRERNRLRAADLRPGMVLFLPAPGGGA